MAKQQESINDAALAYLEEKYGEPFTYDQPWGNSMSGTHAFLAVCESLPGRQVLVEAENYKSGSRSFRDNYLAVKYEEETAAFFRRCAEEAFTEANIFYQADHSASHSPALPADASLEEYLADTTVPHVILAEVKASNFTGEAQAQQLAERLAASGAYFYLSILVLEDGEYGTLDHAALNKRMSHNAFVHCAKITRLEDGLQTRWLEKE